ncbi:MFS transporter [Brevibacillus humidisoli]|uniref:MDR family MFS transporter n=1 Tax=Brevibacillus humidisoli TaxID=2895522 RepID=UPI001E41CCA5|nr:MFS transporter [Brevibacillus humidisoli]UFJ41458.1 MFS transporter [Brevibacillus humidisoli]
MNRIRAFYHSFHPIVHTLLLGIVLVSVARGMSIPFLAVYLATTTQLDAGMIGLIIGAGAIAGTFGGFVGGTLSDFIGRKKVLIGTLYVFALVFFGFVLTANVLVIFLLNIFLSLCISFFDPVSKALMGDLTPPEKRMRLFSFRYTAVNIGFAIGPLIGTALALIDQRVPFLIGAVIYLLYVVFLQFAFRYFAYEDVQTTAEEKITVRSAVEVIRYDRVLGFFILGSIFTMTVMGEMSVTLSQYLKNSFVDGVQLFAILMSVNSVVVILLQYSLTKWAERFTPLTNIVMGSILLAISELGFAYSGNWTFFILSMIVFTLGEILIVPSEYIIVDRITPDGMRGTYYGAHTFNGFGNFIGPWFGGILLTSYGGATMFQSFGLIALLSIFFFWRGQKMYDAKQSKTLSALEG